jgi:hypothetical protein
MADNTLFETVRATEGVSSYDAACRRILSEREILARLMKECIPEYRDCDVDEIATSYILDDPLVGAVPVGPVAPRVSGGRTTDAVVGEGTVTYDIRFTAKVPGSDAEPIGLVVNVEAQGRTSLPYPLINRAQYYCARLLSSQYGEVFAHSRYGDLRKVYSIWVCLRPPKGQENTISRYAFAREDVVGALPDDVDVADLMSVVVVRLGDPGSAGYSNVLGLLGTLLSKQVPRGEKYRVLQDEYGIAVTDELKDEVAMMGTIGELVFEEAREEGLAAGREEGRAEGLAAGREEGRTAGRAEGLAAGREEGRAEGLAAGRAEGHEEGRLEAQAEAVRALAKSLGLSPSRAMDAMGVSLADRAALEQRLGKG